MYYHKDAGNSTADATAVTVEGTFSHTGGTMNFDRNTSSSAVHTLTLNGSSCTVGGAGSITHASAGTGSVFGKIYYNEAGTMTFSRTSTTHTIQQAKQFVNGLYNGVNSSATIEPQVFSGNTNYRMNYRLHSASTVEYNGSDNQVVTGKRPSGGSLIDVTYGAGANYHYGNLKINHLGAIGTKYV